jgi:7-cyano-7-deazaguanine synthase
MKKAIVLLSGGLDSATTLAVASARGFGCYAISFRYGQRHDAELLAAEKVAQAFNVIQHKILDINLGQIGGSALTDMDIAVPEHASEGIPVTYVPARNTIFLALALGYAETVCAYDIFIGVNAVDYSGYPDCRPEFITAFTTLANLATRAGVETGGFQIHAPLIEMSKEEIIKTGVELGVDYSLTLSCYQPDEKSRACGVCDSCRFRKKGFEAAGIKDPTLYHLKMAN